MTTPELEAALAAAHAENKELKDRLAASPQYICRGGSDKCGGCLECLLSQARSAADEAQARLKEARAALRKLASATEVYDLWDCRREAQSLLQKLNEAQ
jgi:hypothetical protein